MRRSTTSATPPDFPAINRGRIHLAKAAPRKTASDLRPSLVAGLVAGAAAGLLLGLLVLVYVNPIIREAEAFEPPSDEPDVVTQAQRDAGTVLGSVVFGAVAGVLLGGAASVLRPLYGFQSPVKWGLFLGSFGFLVSVVVPAIYHPPLPPAVEAMPEGYSTVEEGTPVRQAGYFMLIVAAIAGLFLASVAWNRFAHVAPRKPAYGFACAAATFVGVVALPFLWLPENTYVTEVPASLVQEFQVASFTVRLVFWLMAGWLLGFLGARWTWTSKARRTPV